jgi:fatty-acyl-CoA synthase
MTMTQAEKTTARSQRQPWSYTSATSDVPLLGLTIGDMFDQTVERYPDNPALIVRHQDIRLSYRELQTQVNLCARALMKLGLAKGQRLGIWSPNRAEWTITQIATSKLGIILVNLNPAYRLQEIEYTLKQSGCTALLLGTDFKSSQYTQMILELIPEIASGTDEQIPSAIQSARLPELKTIIRMGQEKQPGMLTWPELLALGSMISPDELAIRQQAQAFDDAINIQYTSGTTGFPKGATLSHHNLLNNGYFVARLQNITQHDKVCIPVPLYHCFGMVMGNLGCITHGATMVYPAEVFDPCATLQTVQDEQCTSLYGVPTMFIAELDQPTFGSFDLSSLRTGVMAGSPCPIEVMRRVIELMHMADVEICYGMTETSPVSAQSRSDAPLEKRVGTVGTIHPHLEIKIVDPSSGQIVPRDTPGELCTRGYSVMLGYWNDPQATTQAIDQARWMHTGDLATLDQDDYISIVGRIKDLVIRGGENVYPREIEEFLYTHPQISDVQVIGVPDAKYGEAIMAWIKVKAGTTLTAEEIQQYCQGKIAHYKIPYYVKFVDAFPMTVTGKIQKYIMRQQSMRELEL